MKVNPEQIKPNIKNVALAKIANGVKILNELFLKVESIVGKQVRTKEFIELQEKYSQKIKE